VTFLDRRNGAGKARFSGAISGLLRPRSGEILFQEKLINAVPPHKHWLSLGISRARGLRKPFANLTVSEEISKWGEFTIRSAGKVARSREQVFQRFPG